MTATLAILARPPLRAILAGAIDYAGLFPPASLDLATVVANYRMYRRSPDAWSLGRLVIPASRLGALSEMVGGAWRDEASGDEGSGDEGSSHEGSGHDASGDDASGDADGATPWRLSALIGPDVALDATRIAEFNRLHAGAATVDSVEARGDTVEAIRALADPLGATLSGRTVFVEIPLHGDPTPLVRAIREIGACAKMRTGGVVADAIPDARDVARFLRACADEEVAFKATAGLHHPLRGDYRLTYEDDSPRATMFGYLNVFLAAARARDGASVDALVTTLESHGGAALRISDADVSWDDLHASTRMLTDTRASFALSFGSCSFREPLDDLQTLFATA